MFDVIQAFKDIANKISSLKTAIDDKLPLKGGTLTGNLKGKYITGTWLQATESNHLSSSPSKFCVQDDSGWLYHRTASEIVSDIGAAKSGHTHSNYSETGHTHSKLVGSKDDVILTGNFFRPSSTNGTITLGGASYRWNVVYAKTGTINTSDLRQKHSLETDMEKYIAMLDKIEPTSYVLNDDKTESRHVGYIAQKVWLAMKESGLDESDFAGFIRDMQDEGSVYTYGLIYSEFIPILHAKIKQQEKRINELEAKLDAILEKLGEQ